MGRKSASRLAVARVVVMSLLMTVISSGPPTTAIADPLAGNVLALGSWDPPGEISVATRTAQAFPLSDLKRTATGASILLISSGVDKTAFPPAAQTSFNVPGDPHSYVTGPDIVGYGTYAASVLLQALPGVSITPMNIYDVLGKPDDRRLWYSLDLAAHYTAKAYDAILIDLPPNHMLDPLTAAMASGEWDRINDLMTDIPLATSDAPHYGIATNWATLNKQMNGRGSGAHAGLAAFQHSSHMFKQMRQWILELGAKGIPVITPSGDLGPNPQTIFGLSNLKEVITVGSTNAGAISPSSASGPSLDGLLKPDLVAPSGIVGLLPAAGSLTKSLHSLNPSLISSSLQPDWALGEPLTTARARLDTSLSSAALVAATLAGLSLEGVKDVQIQRGALRAVSEPLDGVPVWRQGAGELRSLPTKKLVDERPLILGDGNLGMEPSSGVWSRTVPIKNSASTSVGPDASKADFVGVDVDLSSRVFTVTEAAARPLPLVTSSKDNIVIQGSVGDHPYEAGAYCEYREVGLVSQPSLTDLASGSKSYTDHLAVCLVEGTKVRYKPFYIHSWKAPRTSVGIYPGKPVNLLDRGLGVIPVDPTNSVQLFLASAGEDGWAVFNNLPPGSYKFKQFADYGIPTEQAVTSTIGNTTQVKRDPGQLGSPQGYLSFTALVLSSVCAESMRLPGAFCNGEDLEATLGDQVEEHAPTWTHLVGPAAMGEQRVRVAVGCDATKTGLLPADTASSTCMKKAIGSMVISRYIDFPDCPDLAKGSTKIPTNLDATKMVSQSVTADPAWTVHCLASGFSLEYDESQDDKLPSLVNMGATKYSFGLTWPNYTTHIGLNFKYNLNNVVAVIVVQAGTQAGVAVVGPKESYQTTSNDLGRILPQIATKSGSMRVDFDLLSRGATRGEVWMLFLPAAGTSIELAEISDMSMEVDTWTNVEWPPTTLTKPETDLLKSQYSTWTAEVEAAGSVGGHYFWVRPGVNQLRPQVDPSLCRPRSAVRTLSADVTETVSAEVCEDWSIFLHSPKDDAALVDVVTATNVPFYPTPVDSAWPKPGSGEQRTSKIGHLSDLSSASRPYDRPAYYDIGRRDCEAKHDLVFDHSLDTPVLQEGGVITSRGGFAETLSLPYSFVSSVGADWIEFRIADRIAGTGIAGKDNRHLAHNREPGPSNDSITKQETGLMPANLGCKPTYSGLTGLVPLAPYIPNFERITSFAFR